MGGPYILWTPCAGYPPPLVTRCLSCDSATMGTIDTLDKDQYNMHPVKLTKLRFSLKFLDFHTGKSERTSTLYASLNHYYFF